MAGDVASGNAHPVGSMVAGAVVRSHSLFIVELVNRRLPGAFSIDGKILSVHTRCLPEGAFVSSDFAELHPDSLASMLLANSCSLVLQQPDPCCFTVSRSVLFVHTNCFSLCVLLRCEACKVAVGDRGSPCRGDFGHRRGRRGRNGDSGGGGRGRGGWRGSRRCSDRDRAGCCNRSSGGGRDGGDGDVLAGGGIYPYTQTLYCSRMQHV